MALFLEDRNGMLQVISDLSKDAYGFRVRQDYGAMTDDQLQMEWDHFVRVADERSAREEREQANALREWEERTAMYVRNFNITLDRAIAWDIMSEGAFMGGATIPDYEYYCYLLNIPYAQASVIREICGLEKDWPEKYGYIRGSIEAFAD